MCRGFFRGFGGQNQGFCGHFKFSGQYQALSGHFLLFDGQSLKFCGQNTRVSGHFRFSGQYRAFSGHFLLFGGQNQKFSRVKIEGFLDFVNLMVNLYNINNAPIHSKKTAEKVHSF